MAKIEKSQVFTHIEPRPAWWDLRARLITEGVDPTRMTEIPQNLVSPRKLVPTSHAPYSPDSNWHPILDPQARNLRRAEVTGRRS